MRRREFIALLGGAAAWPLDTFAQQPDRVRRVGVLIPFAETDEEAQTRLRAFEETFQKLGWVDGRNVQIERRWASGNPDRIRLFAKELVDLKPDIILAHSTPAVAALQQETHTIPIVFANLSDPVGSGFVSSLSRPGGNITGFTNLEASLSSKWVELLKEISPRLTRIGLLFNPDMAPHANYYLSSFEAAGASLKVQAIATRAKDPAEIEPLIVTLRDSNGGLVVMPDTFTLVHRKRIIALAARHRVPTVYPYRYMATEGGLVSYGIDQTDAYRRAAAYVDRILKGENPGNLPVQAPTKFELVINLKTAKALGLTVPPSLLNTADEVIE